MRKKIAVVLAGALVLAACGTRLPDEAFQNAGVEVVASGDTTGGDGSATDGIVATDGSADGGGATDGGTDGGGTGGGTTGGGTTGGATTGGAATGGTGGGTDGPSGPNQASDVGVTANSITLGTIVAENGVLGDAFAPAARGLRAWTQAINAKGGINGRQVILKTCDDREDRARSLECAKRLVEQDKVFAMVGTNSRALGGAAEYLNSKQIPVVGIPITNSFNRYRLFYSTYGSGYVRDGKTVGHKNQIMSLSGAYRWFKSNLKVSKAAVFFYDIPESSQAGSFIAEGLKLEGFSVTKYPVSFAAPSFDQAVADMERQGTQIVFDAMDDGANRKLCDAMGRRKFPLKAKVSTVVSYGESVRTAYNDTCRNSVYIVGESAPYTRTSVPAIAEFRAAFSKYQPGKPLHQWALEAWAQAVMVSDGIRSMGPAPTRKGLVAFLDGLKSYTANGIFTGIDYRRVDFTTPTRQDCFSVARWLDSKGGWVLAADKFPFCVNDAKQYGTPTLEQGN